MSDKKQVGGVPLLRFPEFLDSGAWEEKYFYDLLDDILDFRGRTPLKLGMVWGDGDIISLSANNVKNGYIDFNAECNLGSQTLYEKWMGKVNLEKGDIVFTMEAPLGNALLIPDSEKYILSQRVVVFKTKEEINNKFLIQLIWSYEFQNTITILSTGSTAKGINQKSLKKVRVFFPSEEYEQQKIANCLASLDQLITAQTQKRDSLKAHKKGLMQQLFPTIGETVPKLRFPEFRDMGAWENKSLKNIATIVMGSSPKSSFYNDEGKGLPLLQGNADIKNRVSVPRIYTSQITKKCFIGDILLSVRAPVGTVAKSKHYACIGRGIASIRANKNNSNQFFYQWFLSFESKWYSISQGGTFDAVNSNDIRLLTISVPSQKEQQKIANCLASLDDVITTQTQKIDTLKAHKKGLMQQLFP